MTKIILRRQVVALRKAGKSYGEIRKIVNVSKSSLSLWLRSVPLTTEQILELKLKKDQAVERYIESMRLKRKQRLDNYYKYQEKKLMPLSERELLVSGLFLYLGEGNKVSRGSLSVANCDPSVITFTFYWMNKILKIPKNKIFIKLHLYRDMNVEDETNYWSRRTGIAVSQFKKPYIKNSNKTDIDQKGFGHGTCTIMVFNTVLKENLMMAIKVITDKYKI